MKKILLFVALLLIGGQTALAQVMEDDFESNQFGWTESVGKRGIAVLREGRLHLESKGKEIVSACYAPFSTDKPFVLTVEALAKKIDDDRSFGIVLDYEDDQNYMRFFISEGEAVLEVIRDGVDRPVRIKREALKLRGGKKVGVEFEVDYNLKELEFKVNGVKALSFQRRLAEGEFLLGTSGIGFFANGGQVIDFDNLKIIQ